jgi:predicted RNA binding protein YcfA (HicA-like mRNA interferase family)
VLADVVCIIHTVKSRDLIKQLEANGFRLISVRGSHHKFRNAANITIVVPHPKKDLGKGLIAAIRKEAGLK